MKAKLLIEDKEIEVEISKKELNKLKQNQVKKTGYERVEERCNYYYDCLKGRINCTTDFRNKYDIELFNDANYYSDETVANNNMRADKLMRQLRRFAVEHRKKELDWENLFKKKWTICYNYSLVEGLITQEFSSIRNIFGIYFDSKETVELAIKEFHSELIWYFTEYKDRLE